MLRQFYPLVSSQHHGLQMGPVQLAGGEALLQHPSCAQPLYGARKAKQSFFLCPQNRDLKLGCLKDCNIL